MPFSIPKTGLPQGPQARILAYSIVMAMFASLTVFIASKAGLTATIQAGTGTPIWWIATVGALSGGIGLFSVRSLFGRDGLEGAGWAALATVIMTIVATTIQAAVLQPVSGTFYAPVLFLICTVNAALFAPTWLISSALAHVLFGLSVDAAAEVREDDEVEVYRPAASQVSSFTKTLYQYK